MTADQLDQTIVRLEALENEVRQASQMRNLPSHVRQAICDAVDNLVAAQRQLLDPMFPLAVDHAAGQLYKADASGNYHPIPK